MAESMSQEELDAMLKSMMGNGEDAEPPEKEPPPPTPPPETEGEAADAAAPAKKPLVQRVEFTQLKPRPRADKTKPQQNLFNNIPLVLSGELGNTEITVRDLLALEEGSVVKLEKVAGESTTVLVNEQYFGQAETVVVNDRFGLRITAIGKEDARDKKDEADKKLADKKEAEEEVEASATEENMEEEEKRE